MNTESLAQEVTRHLTTREEKVVFAESCTAGLAAATLGQIPGISNYLCGSAVTYRADSKRRWLGVKKKTIKKHTTESHQTAREMAFGVLKMTPEANWGVAIVGHVGPDAPAEKDGVIYLAIARRTKKRRLKLKDTYEHRLASEGRARRQEEAVEVILTHLARCIQKKTEREAHTEGKRKERAEAPANGKPGGKKRKVVGADD